MKTARLFSCPSCLSHLHPWDRSADAQVTCPFCDQPLDAQAGSSPLASLALRGSKSAMLAATLGASLAMSACQRDHDPPPQPVYGAPVVVDMSLQPSDRSTDQAQPDQDQAAKPTPAPSPEEAPPGPPAADR